MPRGSIPLAIFEHITNFPKHSHVYVESEAKELINTFNHKLKKHLCMKLSNSQEIFEYC